MAARDRIVQRAFTGGEQSPNLDARADLARWHTALSIMENYIAMVQGGATRRSGTRDVHAALDNSELVPFAFSADDGYAVEFAPLKCRFFRDFAILESAPGVAYELVTPLTADDVAALDFVQSADVLFLACGNRQIQKLSRVAALNFTIADLPVKLGPFLEENPEDGIVLSAAGGAEIPAGTNFTLIASAPLFNPLQVGALFKIAIKDQNKYPTWSPNVAASVGDFRYWGNNLYKCTQAVATTGGANPPVHLYGEAWDGSFGTGGGRAWKYLHSGYGVVKITAYTDTTHVTVNAQTYIPADLHDGTFRWSEGAWSDLRGYPRVVAIHEKRLIAAFTKTRPNRIWSSVIDDYPNFKQGPLDTDGWSYDLQSAANKVNAVRWLISASSRLAIGTAGDEFAIPKSSTREPLTPSNVVVDGATEEGSSDVKAVKVGGPIFVSKDGKRLHGLGYDFSADEYIAPDLTIFADHIAGPGLTKFIQLAWHRDPYRLLWALRDDGVLACSTYRKDQQINAWHRHPTPKGKVKSIAVAPSPEPSRQDLWMIVERALVAGTVRRVESLMPFFERGDLDVKGAWFVDCGFTYSGTPITNVINIPAFLNGETVRILADGKLMPDRIVTAGAVTIPKAASRVTLGLGFASKLKTLRYDRDLQGGVLTGKKNRVAALVVDLLRAAGVKIGAGDRAPEYATYSGGRIMDGSADLFNGPTDRMPLSASWDDDGSATVLCEDPFPATIRAITPEFQEGK